MTIQDLTGWPSSLVATRGLTGRMYLLPVVVEAEPAFVCATRADLHPDDVPEIA